jgi:catechol 2,3-dioxygenase-like lactoylglutathione lyase family enzyme
VNVLGAHHVAFTVDDLAPSVAFFQRLGFEVVAQEDGSACVRRRDVRLRLLAAREAVGRTPPAPNDVGRAHVALQGSDVEAEYAALAGAGETFVSVPQHHHSGLSWVFVRDPGGSGEVEFLQIGRPPSSEEIGHP